MATITVTPIKTFVSGETVTPAKLNDLAESVVALTAGTIVNADVASGASIALSKLATGALPTAITVTTGNIVAGSVNNDKLATGIDASKLTTGTLPAARIADSSVLNAKLGTGIDASKLTTGTLPIARIANLAVDTAKIAANAITTEKIENIAVTTDKLANSAVTTGKIDDEAVTTPKILDANVTNIKIASGIDASKLTIGTLPIARIANESIDTAKLADSAITAVKIEDDAVTTAKIANSAVTAAKIDDDAVTTVKILNANVTNPKIASGIDASKLTTGTLPIARIADEAVDTEKIADDAIITAKIANASVTAAKLNGAQTGSAPVYGCRAWVRFDGQKNAAGTASTANTNRLIIADGNVASVLRTAEGSYTVTFTTPMPTADYAAVVSARHATSVTYGANAETNIISSSAVGIVTGASVGGLFDPDSVNLAVFA